MMTQYRNILFNPLAQSGNGEAAATAADLARRHGAKLTLAGIVPEPTKLQTILQPWEVLRSAMDRSQTDLAMELQRWCPSAADVDCEFTVRVGSPSQDLLDLVHENGHDLLIVTADADSRLDPVVKRLLRSCPCPVWVIRQGNHRAQRILAAVNPDPDELEFNQSILRQALALQTATQGHLDIVGVWEFYGESTLRHSAFLPPADDEVERIVQAEHASYLDVMEELVASMDLGDREVAITLVRGRPAETLAALIDHRRIDQLIIGTVARRGLGSLVFGNTAERLIDSASCSIMAVKPPWFGAQVGLGTSAPDGYIPKHRVSHTY